MFNTKKEERTNKFMTDDLSQITSDTPTIICFAIDKSGSMDEYCDLMRETLSDFQSTICGMTEVNAIRIGMFYFDSYVHFDGFKHPTNMDTSYYPRGGTALYDAIGVSCENLKRVTNELYGQGLAPKGLIFVLSDGGENDSDSFSKSDCTRNISDVNELGFNTVYVSFKFEDEDDVENKKNAEEMGFDIVCSVEKSVTNLRKILTAATKSVQSISQSVGAKPDIQNFFEDITG